MARRNRRQDALKSYRKRIETSRNWRRTEQYDETWRRLSDLYAGKHFFGDLEDQDRIAVNVAFATINVIYPTVSVNRPRTTVLARDADQQDRALIAEAVVNAWWDTYDVLPEVRLAVKDSLICGHGWVKCGWRYTEEEVDRPPEEVQADFDAARMEADQAASENPEVADQLPTDDDLWATIERTKAVVKEDRPFVERVSPHDIYVDPEATTERDMAWIAQRIVRPLDAVRKDPRYDAKARNACTPDRGVNPEYLPERERNERDDDVLRVTVWEFYDLATNQMSVFAEGGDGFLVKPSPIPYKSGHPFEMVRNYDVPDRFYPMGDLEGIEPLQQELNKTRSQLMAARKQFGRKHLYFEDAFGPEGRAALESDVDGVMVPVRGQQRQLTEVIAPLPTNPIPTDIYNYSQIIESDIETVSGVTDYQRGGASQGVRRTATEAAIIQDSVNARSAEKLSIIEKFIARVSKRLIELARQFSTAEDTVRIVGAGGRTAYVPWEPDDLDADLDYVVEAGSTVPKGEDYRRQEAMTLISVLSPFIGTVLDPAKIVMYVLEQFGVKNPQKFMAEMDPMAMAMAMAGGQQPGMPGAPSPDGEGGPGPENNPMAQDPDLAAVMGAMNPQAAQAGVPAQPVIPNATQLQGQVGLNLR